MVNGEDSTVKARAPSTKSRRDPNQVCATSLGQLVHQGVDVGWNDGHWAKLSKLVSCDSATWSCRRFELNRKTAELQMTQGIMGKKRSISGGSELLFSSADPEFWGRIHIITSI